LDYNAAMERARTTSVTLGNHYVKFLEDTVATGRYGSVSEVMREALRRFESEQWVDEELRREALEGPSADEMRLLDADLAEGASDGDARPWREVLQELRARR
jgi:antitoxin ParD1/3/4